MLPILLDIPVVQYTINGILYGGVLALGAVGFSIIFGVLDIIDLSHGVQLILGAYISFFLWQAGINPLLTIPVVMAILFCLGYIYQRYLISRVPGGESLQFLLLTFGVALIGRDLMTIFWSPTYRSITPPYADNSVNIGTVLLSVPGIIALVLSLVLIGFVTLALYRTQIGREIRAIAEDAETAGLTGINVPHMYALTFGIGAAFTGAAGTLLGLTSTFSPISAPTWTLYAFVVLVIGGIGRPLSAIIGGIVIGLVSAYVTALLTATWGNVAIFTLLVVVLIIRPQGLLGELGEGTS
jgi:branched-chain amino acid transport system permease protein